MRHTILACFIMCSILKVHAQDNFTTYFEPEIKLEYKITSKYSHGFAIENRNFFYRDSEFQYEVQHLEFAHTSEFLLNKNQTLALGIQYRFKGNFNSSEDNEFRVLQAFEWTSNKSQFSKAQKIRTEQRFYTSITKYRLRYELGFMFPLTRIHLDLDDNAKNTTYIKVETETLFEIAKTQKPEYEQRLSGVYGFKLTPKTIFEIGVQYRLGDYTQDLEHELFFVTSVAIKL